MRVTSTSCTVVSWAETRSDSLIRWAMTWRRRGILTVVPGCGPSALGLATAAGALGCDAGADGADGADAAGASGSRSGPRGRGGPAAGRPALLRVPAPAPGPENLGRAA